MTFEEWWPENGWEGDSAYKAARSAWNAAKAPDESAALGLAEGDKPNLAGPEGDARPAPHRHDAGCFDCCPGPEWPQ